MSAEVQGKCLPTITHPHKPVACPQLPGTVLRIFIPPGAVINLLNIIEVTSPGGICLIVRLPILGGVLGTDGKCGKGGFSIADIMTAVKNAGGNVEVVGQ